MGLGKMALSARQKQLEKKAKEKSMSSDMMELKKAKGATGLYKAAEKNNKKIFKEFKRPDNAMEFYQKKGDRIKGLGAYSSGGPVLKNPNKADLDKSGNLSSYEKKRGKAIEKSMGLKSGGLALKGYGKAYMKGGKVK